MNQPITIDAHALEVAAARGLNQADIAKEFGCADLTLRKKMKQDPELRAAYERGLGRAGRKPRARSASRKSPVQTPAPAKAAGPPCELVLEAIPRGARTYGQLMHATGLTHDAVTHAVEKLMQRGAIFARVVGEERRHYVKGETPAAAEETADAPAPVEAQVVSDRRLAPAVARSLPDERVVSQTVPPPYTRLTLTATRTVTGASSGPSRRRSSSSASWNSGASRRRRSARCVSCWPMPMARWEGLADA